MKWTMIIVVVAIAGICAFAYLQSQSLWHAGIIYSRLELRRALKDLSEKGALPDYGNSIRPFLFTNVVTIGGTNYQGAVAYDDPKFYGKGFLVATTNGTFIYLDKRHRPG